VQSAGSAALSEPLRVHSSDFVPVAYRWASRTALASSRGRSFDGLPSQGYVTIRVPVPCPLPSDKSVQVFPAHVFWPSRLLLSSMYQKWYIVQTCGLWLLRKQTSPSSRWDLPRIYKYCFHVELCGRGYTALSSSSPRRAQLDYEIGCDEPEGSPCGRTPDTSIHPFSISPR
jgi:hypothetical protein